jgi:hypothetical protein
MIKIKPDTSGSGLIPESLPHSVEIKTFLAEVDNEILTGELRGDIKDSDYLSELCDGILNSIKKK